MHREAGGEAETGKQVLRNRSLTESPQDLPRVGWMILAYFPYNSSRNEGRGGRGGVSWPFQKWIFHLFFFTIFSIFPKAIIHLEIALHIKGNSAGGEKRVLKVVSNPPLNINGFIWKPAFFCMKTCFFPISFPPSSLPLASGAACELNLPWAEAALQARACTPSLLQSQQFISTPLPYPTVQAMK